ncbi:MAG: hypothetical protein LIO92_01565 [Clostridiales bacterium]|nr:hypothetical protein [Clostridiales bacterium]
MVEIYADNKKIPYDEAFYQFAASRTYKAIFDFKTGIWREGAYYFLALYEEEMEEQQSSIKK